jgi:PqqD family protein of HPr-rel-A system
MPEPASTSKPACYRIPSGVVFQRWAGDGEFVVYHSGTGETLRLSEGAVAILDLLERMPSMSAAAIADALTDMIDDPPAPDALWASLETLLAMLLRHECIERVACS